MNVRLTREQLDWLENKAELPFYTKSHVLRDALTTVMKGYESPDNFTGEVIIND